MIGPIRRLCETIDFLFQHQKRRFALIRIQSCISGNSLFDKSAEFSITSSLLALGKHYSFLDSAMKFLLTLLSCQLALSLSGA